MSPAEDRLMRYFDGELEAEAAADVERLLADSPEARALLGDFEQVGTELRAIAEDQGTRADGIADRVMARLEPSRGSARLRSGERGARGRVIRLAPVVGLALAAAAVVAFLLQSRPPQPIVRASESATVSVPVPPESAAPAEEFVAAEEEPETGATIESVDFGAQNGTIFMVAIGPQVTPVVWLVDESARTGGRMKPL